MTHTRMPHVPSMAHAYL